MAWHDMSWHDMAWQVQALRVERATLEAALESSRDQLADANSLVDQLRLENTRKVWYSIRYSMLGRNTITRTVGRPAFDFSLAVIGEVIRFGI